MKTALNGLSRTDKDFSKLENMSLATCKTEKTKRKKRMKKLRQSIQELWDKEKRCDITVMGKPEKEGSRRETKEILE